jgi:hypothetical protein
MKLIVQTPQKALKAFIKQRPLRSEIDKFKVNLIAILDKINTIENLPNDETEEHLKNNGNLKYLTGLLNSKLVAFWLRKKGKMQGNAYQLDKEPLLEIPIYEANITEQENIATLVDQIIAAKQQNQDTKALEAQIDQMIYKLYELTD